MSTEKTSILEDAATDLQEIVEAAKKMAKDNLAKELPQKFDMLLNEELENVSSKESVNESVKDKYKKEPVKGKKTDNKKESINEELDMTECSLEEVENAFDTASDTEQFSITPNEETNNQDVTVDSIAQAINSIGDLNNEQVMAQEQEVAVSDPYTKFKELAEQMAQMVKEIDDKKMHEEYGTQFESQMSGLYGESFKKSLGDDKCNELYEMFVANKSNVNESTTEPFNAETLTENEDEPFEDKANSSTEQGSNIAEQKKNGGEQKDARENGGPTNAMIEEKFNFEKGDDADEAEVVDDKVEVEVDGTEDKDDVDEAMGMAHSTSKHAAGDHLPGKEFAKHRHKRVGSVNNPKNENYVKRMKSLIEENKKLTKDNNLAKKSFTKAENLVESYKTHLEKYRTQLRDMAVFNTNLANVNNLLVNEEFALTSKDKSSIINKFKSINSINESDKVYGQVMDFMKKGVKTISEDVEKKMTTVSAVPAESTKKKIDEAIERTAYADNKHIEKIKGLMKYVDDTRNK